MYYAKKCFGLFITNIIKNTFISNSSFDARDSNLEKGSHWVDDKTLGGRAYFQAAAEPATLTIESMKSVDSGLYRCRVDFLKTPTRNSRVQLKVISE